MKIILNLSRNCIETASKKEYERLIKHYFKSSEADQKEKFIEPRINALNYFLENADFPELRHQCQKIGLKGEVILIVPQRFCDMHVRFNKTMLYPKWK